LPFSLLFLYIHAFYFQNPSPLNLSCWFTKELSTRQREPISENNWNSCYLKMYAKENQIPQCEVALRHFFLARNSEE
jgi:hypothetical protein